MCLENYQLNKEEEWYYLSKKRILAFNYVNASVLSSALVELSQWNGKPNTKACSPSSISELTDSKSVKNLSPLVLTAKDRSFETGCENVSRSSPLTVKSDGHSPSEPKRHSRESSLSLEKRTTSEIFNLENISLINRRRSKELVLKMMKGSHDSLTEGERIRGSEPLDKVTADSPTAASMVVRKQIGSIQNETLIDDTGIVDEQLNNSNEVLQENVDPKDGECVNSPKTPLSSAAVTSMIDSPTIAGSAIFSPSRTGSQVTSAVQSPVFSDVSIQLTKTDGHCEPFRSSPERSVTNPSMTDDSFDSEDLENAAVLKRCSSFAGFKSEVPNKHDHSDENHSHSQLKGPPHVLIGHQGRARHCSAPVSGQGTPRNKVSVLPYTPSCISSRGSFTEDGECEYESVMMN